MHAASRPLQPPLRIEVWSPADFSARVDELLTVYVSAMRYPELSLDYRRPIWLEHSRRSGFVCLVALDEDGGVAGVCYGYTGAEKQWWNTEVQRGMDEAQLRFWMSSYRELTELHVRPDRQGAGTGEALLRAFLTLAPERAVLLSTPEGENRAWRLYRRFRFQDVLRHYQFTGDARPFAVLGRVQPPG